MVRAASAILLLLCVSGCSKELASTPGPLEARLTVESEWVGGRGLHAVPVGYLSFETPKGRAKVAARCREEVALVESPDADRLAYRCGDEPWHVVYVGRANAIGLTSCETWEGAAFEWGRVPVLASAARGLLRCNEEHRFDLSGQFQMMAERFSKLVDELSALDEARVNDFFVQTLELDFAEDRTDGWVETAVRRNLATAPTVRAAAEKILSTKRPSALALARLTELLGPGDPAVQRSAMARLSELTRDTPAPGSPTPLTRAITQLLRASALAKDEGVGEAACLHLEDFRTGGAARLVLASTGAACAAMDSEWSGRSCSPHHLCGEEPGQAFCEETMLASELEGALAERLLAWRYQNAANLALRDAVTDRLRLLWAMRRGLVTDALARSNLRLSYAVDAEARDRLCATVVDAGVRCPCETNIGEDFRCGIPAAATEANHRGCVFTIDDVKRKLRPAEIR